MDIRNILGRNVRRLRLEMGLSQEEFGLRFDMDRTYVSGIERGVRNPTIEVLAKLADAFDVAAFELLRPVDK